MQPTDSRMVNDLARRKRRVVAALVLSGLFLVALNCGAWLRYLQTRDELESLHGEGMLALARTAAQYLRDADIQALRTGRVPDSWEVEHQLRRLQEVNLLGALFVVDLEARMLLDTRTPTAAGHNFGHLGADTLVCQQALAGMDATGDPHRIGNELFRVAAVPVWTSSATGERRVGAALGVDAAAPYLSVLRSHRRWLYSFGALSLVGLAAIIGVLGGSVVALIHAQDALRESEQLALVGRLAPAIAHEIRNPLEIIKGSADVIRRKYAKQDSEEQDEIFEFIPAEVERIDRLIAEFLSLSRPVALSIEAVDLGSVVKRIVAGLRPRLEAAGIRAEVVLPDPLPLAAADEDRLEQMILNLVVNALNSLEERVDGQPGLLRIVVLVADWQGAKGLSLAVEDNGPGVAPEHAERIFEPFFTTRGALGTGLGLAVARKIAKDHRGDLRYQSRNEGGARFLVRIPAA